MESKQNYPTDLTDEGWALVSPLLPAASTKPLRVDLRSVLNAIFYIQKTGCQWHMLPKDFPKYQAVRYHYDKWMKMGVFEKINEKLSALARIASGKSEAPRVLYIDSQTVASTFVGNIERGFDGGKKYGVVNVLS